jgi:hypothetical protein
MIKSLRPRTGLMKKRRDDATRKDGDGGDGGERVRGG